MNAIPPGFDLAAALPGSAAEGVEPRWAALHDAAGIVASLAGVPVPPAPAPLPEPGGWRSALIRQGIDDLAAVMEPGLAALLAVAARRADPAPAALALWQEFAAARDALLALALEPAAD